MKVIELAAPRIDALHSSTYPDLTPGPGDVLIRLRAASLNFLDIAVAMGKYPLSNFPIIPVTDGAGEIAALGTAVTSWRLERASSRTSSPTGRTAGCPLLEADLAVASIFLAVLPSR